MRLAAKIVPAVRLAAVVAFAFLANSAFAQPYSYVTPADLKQQIESGKAPMILDIQVEGDYAKNHLPGAVPTYAYPAKSDAERAKLKPALDKILASKDEVVIVCPGGKSGAENTWAYLKQNGVAESRMKILENGQKGWPYSNLVQKGN